MKNFILIILSAAFLLTATACGQNADSESEVSHTVSEQAPVTEETPSEITSGEEAQTSVPADNGGSATNEDGEPRIPVIMYQREFVSEGKPEVNSLQPGGFTFEYENTVAGYYTCFRVDKSGVLYKIYEDRRENDSEEEILFTKPLTDKQIEELIEVIFANDFFNLPISRPLYIDSEEMSDGYTWTFITITVDEEEYFCTSLSSEYEKYYAIRDYVLALAEDDSESPSNKDNTDILQTGSFSLEYELLTYLGGCTVRIDEAGTLTKELEDVYGEVFDTSERKLSDSEMKELAEIITNNRFFNLPANVDDYNGPTGQAVQRLTVSYNGKSHECKGYGTLNEEFSAICEFIEQLAEVKFE